MTEWFLRIIGVSDDIRTHLEQATLEFQRPLVLWLGVVLLVPIGYYIYRRQRTNLLTVPPPLRAALTATRIAILLILIVVLAGPYLKLDQQIEKKPIVALVFDQSQSMALPAGPFESDAAVRQVAEAAGYQIQDGQVDAETRKLLNQMGRAKLAQEAVQHSAQEWLAPLTDNYDLRFYSLAGDLTRLPVAANKLELPEPRPDGAETHLGDGLAQLLEEAAGRQIGGVVLFSDGQNTGGRSPVESARAAAESEAPIFAVPAGSEAPLRDIAVLDVFAPDLVSVGDSVNVSVTLEVQGYSEQPVKVILRDEGSAATDGAEPLDAKELVLRSTEQQHLDLTFEAKSAGARTLTVEVQPAGELPEDLPDNNSDSVVVRVSDEKLRVLYLEGLPRWDFRFLKNAMRRDHGLGGRGLKIETPSPAVSPPEAGAEATAAPATGPGVATMPTSTSLPDIVLEAELRRRPPQEQAVLPQTLDALAEYHVVILGDVSTSLVDPGFVELLATAVRERGLGLLVAAGPVAMPHTYDERFVELLPVRLRPQAAGIEAPAYKPFRLEVSPDGAIHESMRLYDDAGRNDNAWAQMPPYYWCAAAERPSAAATVLAYNPSIEGRFGKVPLVAHHYAGQGKVMFVGTDSTWLWRQNVGDRFFYKFWGQAIRFVARRDANEIKKKSYVEVRPVRARPGKSAQIELLAFSADGSPRREPQLALRVLREGAAPETVDMTADAAGGGRYVGKFAPSAPGNYRLVYEPGATLEPVEARLHVARATEELRRPNVNVAALAQLGSVVTLDKLATIPAQLKGEAKRTALYREASIWDNWLVLSLLVVIYSLDVGLRRLAGLS